MSLFDFLSGTLSLAESGICQGMVDCHSHLIPGVDDGIQKMEDALSVLQGYEKLGVKELYCTPHIMEDLPNTSEKLRKGFSQLCEAYQGPIQLHLAAEYMIDNLLLDRLEVNDLLPHGAKKDHLLVETSYYSSPGCFEAALEKVRTMGYWPMLAHPERYCYMDMGDYDRLKSEGVKFQLNVTSLLGKYGEDAQKKAQMLLEKGMYDFLGTDVHRYDPQFAHRKVKKRDAERVNLIK